MSSQVEQSKEAFHYQKYGDDLSRLFEATANLLEREWPAKYKVDSARTIFFQSVRIAINTYYTIMFISADIPKDPHRKPAFALSLAPLTRTLFEQLITFIFIIEGIPRYIPWLFKTGYTEYWIQLEHTRQYHAHDVKWDPYVKELKDQMVKVERETGLTPDEVSNPRRNIGRWPTPGGMLRILKQDHPTSTAIPVYLTCSYLRPVICVRSRPLHVSIHPRNHFFLTTGEARLSRFGARRFNQKLSISLRAILVWPSIVPRFWSTGSLTRSLSLT